IRLKPPFRLLNGKEVATDFADTAEPANESICDSIREIRGYLPTRSSLRKARHAQLSMECSFRRMCTPGAPEQFSSSAFYPCRNGLAHRLHVRTVMNLA